MISVLLIALLYFALIELIMAESARKMREAQRFRARITANILAENGAELAAAGMTGLDLREASLENDDGEMSGTFRRVGEDSFVIEATGTTKGVVRSTRNVSIKGRIVASSVRIDETRHDR